MTQQTNNGHFEGSGQDSHWVPDAPASSQTPEELVAQLYDSGAGKAFDPKALGLVPIYEQLQGQGQDTSVSSEQTGWSMPNSDGYTYHTYDMNGNTTAQGRNDPNGMKHFLEMGALAMATAGVAGAYGVFGDAASAATAGTIPVDAGSLAAAGGAAVTSGASAAGDSIIQQLATQYGKSFTLDNLGKQALQNAIVQYATTGHVDLSKLALSAAVAPIATTAANAVTGGMDAGTLRNIASGATRGGTSALLTGGNAGLAALVGAVAGGVGGSKVASDAKTALGLGSNAPKIDTGTGIGGWNSTAYLPEAPYVPTTDYSSGADYTLDGPRTSDSLYGTVNPSVDAGNTPVDYSVGAPTNSGNMQMPTYPDLTSMNNAQGLTVDTTSGGKAGAIGYVPPDPSVILGDPNSFINNATVLGNTVIGTDTIRNPDGTGTSPVATTKSATPSIPVALQKLQSGMPLTPAEIALLKSIGMFENTYGEDLPGLLKSFYASTNRGGR